MQSTVLLQQVVCPSVRPSVTVFALCTQHHRCTPNPLCCGPTYRKH